MASSDVSLPTQRANGSLPFRCLFASFLLVKRGFRQQDASSLGVWLIVATLGARMRYGTWSALDGTRAARSAPNTPPPTRSGNAFAAAVVVATVDLLFLVALFEWLAL
jgi:hypothetical protein